MYTWRIKLIYYTKMDEASTSTWTWKRKRTEDSDSDSNLKYTRLDTTLQCSLQPSCTLLPPFPSKSSYQEHHTLNHHLLCNECKRHLPTFRLLDLHLMEIHDSFFTLRCLKGDCYECYVDGCKALFKNVDQRNSHLIQKHEFPSKFHFDVILGVGKVKKKKKKKKQVEDSMDIDQLTQTLQSLKFGGSKGKHQKSLAQVTFFPHSRSKNCIPS